MLTSAGACWSGDFCGDARAIQLTRRHHPRFDAIAAIRTEIVHYSADKLSRGGKVTKPLTDVTLVQVATMPESTTFSTGQQPHTPNIAV
jgi:hypothetical protein